MYSRRYGGTSRLENGFAFVSIGGNACGGRYAAEEHRQHFLYRQLGFTSSDLDWSDDGVTIKRCYVTRMIRRPIRCQSKMSVADRMSCKRVVRLECGHSLRTGGTAALLANARLHSFSKTGRQTLPVHMPG